MTCPSRVSVNSTAMQVVVVFEHAHGLFNNRDRCILAAAVAVCLSRNIISHTHTTADEQQSLAQSVLGLS